MAIKVTGTTVINDSRNIENITTINGTDWATVVSNASAGSEVTVDELTDVTLGTLATGEVLQYNGSAWVNTGLDFTDIASTLADAQVVASNVTQHQAALTITESQISDLGTYETADATILKDADIGVTVEAYDATILKDADIGVNVEAFDATILKDADIGVNVQAYNANYVVDATYVATEENFSSNLLTRLNNIEAGADVTDTLNVTQAGALMDSEVTNLADVKAFDPADYQVAGSYEAADATILKDADIGVNVQAYNANYVVDATYVKTDENFTTADHTKLDTIEDSATADQTGAEIKALYEAESDTNAFDDNAHDKLSAIEALADVTDATNVEAAGAVMDSELTSETDVKAINQSLTTTADVDFNTVTVAGDPTAALELATKQYVDTLSSSGIHYHAPVRVASVANISAAYDNGTAGVGSTLTNSGTQAAISISGVTLNLNDRVLITAQNIPTSNGVYKVTTLGDGSTNWVLTRTDDTDSYAVGDPDSFGAGDAFFVNEGDNSGELYVHNTDGEITFGTTWISFTKIADTAVYGAGNGIDISGTTFSHSDTSSQATETNTGRSYIQSITLDTYGHITGITSGTETVTDTTYDSSDFTHDDLQGFVANEHIDWTVTGNTIHADNYTNTTYTVGDGGLTENNFTNADHTKLDGIAIGATNVTDNNQIANGAGYVTTDTNTTYTAGTGMSLSGTTFNCDITDTNTTYTAGTGMSLSGTTFNCDVVNTDTDTLYYAGGGLSVSGTTFSVDSDLRGDAWIIGRDSNDYIAVDADKINFVLDGNLDMRLENDGDLHVDGNVVAYSTTTSDERLKKDIVKIDNALDKVSQLNGYTFEYLNDGKKSAGILAQEVEAVMPSAVTEMKLPLKSDDDQEYKVVQYDQLHGLLIEAIKELKAEIEVLKGK